MLKICGSSIYGPLVLIFKKALSIGLFPSNWKKGNIAPIHKKSDKQILKNYRPVSLLPICGKIFERLIFKNNLVLPDQSEFKPGDSCINQLLSITHEIYSLFDEGLEVRSAFLDISKAFCKVWHKGLLFELSQNGISGNLLDLLSSFLSDRKQRVLLNGQTSTWQNVTAGVPQRSILGPLLFLIYINNLSGDLSSKAKLLADDPSLFSVTHDTTTSANELNNDLKKISDWAFQWKMIFNPDPSKQAQEVIFSRKLKNVSHPPLVFNNVNISSCKSQKHLGILLHARLTFEEHYKTIISKTNETIGLLRKLQSLLPRAALISIYKAFVRPHGDVLYDQAFNASFHEKLESIQYNACLALTGAIRGTSKEKMYQELGLESLQIRRWYRKLCLFYKMCKSQSPSYLYNIIPTTNTHYTFKILTKFLIAKPNTFFSKILSFLRL